MKLQTTLAVVLTALTIGVTAAAADPDGYQAQLQGQSPTDVFDRYLLNNAPTGSDAFDRYLSNNAPLGAETAAPEG